MSAAASCTLCLSSELHPRLFAHDYNRGIGHRGFHYATCGACKTVQLLDAPEDLGPYYADAYFRLPSHAPALTDANKVDRFKMAILERFTTPGDLLEVGPGAGGFIQLAKSSGYRAQVLERDEDCRRFIAQELGIRAFAGPENLSGFEAHNFDCVTLWHVLEHLGDIRGFLDGLARVLRPGGIAILALPNPDSLQFRLFKRYWAHLDAPRHLALPSAESLIASAREHKLETEMLTFSDAATLYWNRFGWIRSMRNIPSISALRAPMTAVGLGLATISYLLGRLDPSRSAYTLVLRRSAE